MQTVQQISNKVFAKAIAIRQTRIAKLKSGIVNANVVKEISCIQEQIDSFMSGPSFANIQAHYEEVGFK